MLTLYGLKNCDTCRKALKILDGKGVVYQFHDLRADGLSSALLEHLLAQVPVMTLLNRRSTTWRNLDEAAKRDIDADSARKLLLGHPTLIKRPLLDTGDTILVGYQDGDYDKI